MIENWKKSDPTSNNSVDCFRKNVVVIDEEWFNDINLTGGANFPTPLIKHAKTGFNKKLIFQVIQSDAYSKLK